MDNAVYTTDGAIKLHVSALEGATTSLATPATTSMTTQYDNSTVLVVHINGLRPANVIVGVWYEMNVQCFVTQHMKTTGGLL